MYVEQPKLVIALTFLQQAGQKRGQEQREGRKSKPTSSATNNFEAFQTFFFERDFFRLQARPVRPLPYAHGCSYDTNGLRCTLPG